MKSRLYHSLWKTVKSYKTFLPQAESKIENIWIKKSMRLGTRSR